MAGDLGRRSLTTDGPDRLRIADIAFVPTAAGFLLLAVVLDAGSRRTVGRAFSHDLRTGVVRDARDMAVAAREPEDVIHHATGQPGHVLGVRSSLRGGGHPAIHGSLRRRARRRPRRGSVFATLGREPIARHRFATRAEARIAAFPLIEGFDTASPRHPSIGAMPPASSDAVRPPIPTRP